jgi:integrase
VNTLPQKKIDKLRTIMLASCKKRFKRSRTPKYGTMNKGFTESELELFLRNVKNAKFRLLFKYQAYLGLRVGEVCRLNLSNIDFDKRELTLKTEKSQVMDSLKIPIGLFSETADFIHSHGKAIAKSAGFIFYKDNDNNKNGRPHINEHYARKVFREAVIASDLDTAYGESDESLYHRTPRVLHKLTTHSLRHYAITKFAKSSNGNVVLTSRFARHCSPNMTMRYIAKDNEQLYDQIENIFSVSQAKSLKSRLLHTPRS